MVFSKTIIKLGKSPIVNAFVKRDNLMLYFSKANNVINKKTIKLNSQTSLSGYVNINGYSEILPVTDSFVIRRLGDNLWVSFDG